MSRSRKESFSRSLNKCLFEEGALAPPSCCSSLVGFWCYFYWFWFGSVNWRLSNIVLFLCCGYFIVQSVEGLIFFSSDCCSLLKCHLLFGFMSLLLWVLGSHLYVLQVSLIKTRRIKIIIMPTRRYLLCHICFYFSCSNKFLINHNYCTDKDTLFTPSDTQPIWLNKPLLQRDRKVKNWTTKPKDKIN